MKSCTKCKTGYPATLEYFPPEKRRPDGLNSWCRECGKIANKKWRKSEKGKVYFQRIKNKYAKTKKGRLSAVKANLKYRYDITLDQYDEMLKQQNGVCAICKLPEVLSRLSVDHCHKTGKVRGLLCRRCNVGVAMYELYKEKFKKYLRGI